MRKLILGVTLAAIGIAVSSGWSHATDIRTIAAEIGSSFKSSNALPERLRAVSTELKPGLRVYAEDGEFLGTLSAFSHKDGRVNRVWFGDHVTHGDRIELVDGHVIFRADTKDKST